MLVHPSPQPCGLPQWEVGADQSAILGGRVEGVGVATEDALVALGREEGEEGGGSISITQPMLARWGVMGRATSER